jgi:hypothetical protein
MSGRQGGFDSERDRQTSSYRKEIGSSDFGSGRDQFSFVDCSLLPVADQHV